MSNSTLDNSTLTLVLMAGLPAVGKSTLAHKLGRKYDWLVIDKDRLKDQLLRDGLNDYDAGYEAYEWSFKAVREELENNHSVILDTAALHTFILDKAYEIISDMKPVQVRLKVLFLVVADRKVRTERIKNRPPQTTVIRVNPSTTAEYLDCYKHLPLPPGSFYLDTSTQQPDDYLPRASHYIESDEEKYNDDEEQLRNECKSPALSKAR